MARWKRVTILLFIVFLASSVASSPSAAAARMTGLNATVVPILPGVYVITNPCALSGSGEDITLVSGQVSLDYDYRGRLRHVEYQDVRGVGAVSGEEYAIAYQEFHRYVVRREHFQSKLVATGQGMVMTEKYAGWTESLKHTLSCA
jgi:hypothetical protein